MIELMIMGATIAVFVAIAVRVYKDYTLRAGANDRLNTPCSIEMAESRAYSVEGFIPSDDNDAGITVATCINGNDDTDVSINAGVITLGCSGGQTLSGKSLVLSPVTNAGSIQWVCDIKTNAVAN